MTPSKKILGAALGTFLLNGIVEPFVATNDLAALAFIHGMALSVICYLWVKADAKERGTIAPGRSALWAAVLPIVGLPVYFLRTRKPLQAFAGIGKTLVFCVALALLSEAVIAGVHAILNA
jgi:hypothetical protein